MKPCFHFLLLPILVSCQSPKGDAPGTAPDRMLLRPNPANPRYFADPSGNAVYLTGAHTWNNLLDMGPGNPPAAFDWRHYLDFLEANNHNFIRLWSSQTLHNGSLTDGFGATPLAWQRTGPGLASDGGPRLDLTRFNEAYFERLRDRIERAQDRGIYVGVMLFEGWCATVGNTKGIGGHAFAGGNNVNGVDILTTPRNGIYADWVTLDDPEVVRLQELYVRKVVEAVNEFDNVLYEIANEPTGLSHAWQEHFIAFIRQCERNLPKQHMIGAPGGMKTSNARMFASSADWVSPDIQAPDDPGREGYKLGTLTWGEPEYDAGDKVVILDTDHIWGIGGNVEWVWKSFCRGYQVLYMDPAKDWPGAFFTGMDKWPSDPDHAIRREMGVVRSTAQRLDLNACRPHNELSSSAYCLADPGRQYLVFQAEGGPFEVRAEAGAYAAEWHFPGTGETIPVAGRLILGQTARFDPPEAGPAVLFLQRLD